MTHTWTQPEAAGGAGTETSNPLAVKGMPGEEFSFTIAMDSNDDIANSSSTAPLAEVSGLYSAARRARDAPVPDRDLQRAARRGIGRDSSALGGGGGGPTRTVPASVMPVTLFIWGPGRIVPVRVTALTITEQLYDQALNPVHAAGAGLAPGAHAGRAGRGLGGQRRARRPRHRRLHLHPRPPPAARRGQPGNAAASIIGMIPH